MYAPQQQIDQVEYASKITDELFTFYEDYFQIEYTLPKSGEKSSSKQTYTTIKYMNIAHNKN